MISVKWRGFLGGVVLVLAAAVCVADETALDRYVAKPDPAYGYTLYQSDQEFAFDRYFINMRSQQWRSAAEVDRVHWDHELEVVVPRLTDQSSSENTALLIVNGGSNGSAPGTEPNSLVSTLAVFSGSVVAMISQVPNQPLNFSDEPDRSRSEDEILAYSLDKYLATGDEEWPVHLAMTKAVVRAMDTVQEFLRSRDTGIDDFIVLGGSKRGWTTWLTAAVDSRVKAIVPISIDLLNMEPQFRHHWEAYGFYAPAIRDYAEFDLPCRVASARGRELLEIIDPYAYRDRYTLPKLIINSAGDQFFVTDSSNFYFDQLPGPKSLRYTFNTDHAQGESEQQLLDLVGSSLLWIDDVNSGHESPDFDWRFEADGAIRVETRDTPSEVRLVQANNPHARDFRLERIGAAWTRSELEDTGGGVYVGRVDAPAQGYTAFAVELVYESVPEIGYTPREIYTTDVRVVPEGLPFAGTACREGRTILSGNVRINNEPVCAMVLANGRHTFSCGPIPGWFQLDVPLDENGESTLFAFAEGFAPYRRTFVPDGVPIAVDTQYADGQSPTPVLSIQRRDAPSVPNWVEITGTVAAVDGTPLCGMVLANGQYTFSCDDAMGEFSLTVPPDTDNSVTVFGFVDGFMPAKQAVAP